MPIPTFPHIRAYVQAGGLINSTVQAQTPTARSPPLGKHGATAGRGGGQGYLPSVRPLR